VQAHDKAKDQQVSEQTDAQLVAGVLGGDRDAFAAMYDRYADRLHDFCWSVLRDRDEAADAVQDTFVLVAKRLTQLNDPDRLRPWLYAVARSVALRRVRARKWVVLDEAEDMADTDPGPDRAAEQTMLRELVWSAAAGLSERDRALLDLHVRQGLDGAELGEAMGVTANHAYVLLTRLRDQVERSLGALLVARQGRRDCTDLDALLSDWDGRYSPLMRKRVARHVDACAVCSDRRRVMVSPIALLAAVPLLPAPLYLKDQVMTEVALVAHESPLVSSGRRNRWRVPVAAAALLALLGGTGAALYLADTDSTPGTPLALDTSLSTTSSRTTTTLPGPPTGSATAGVTTTTTTTTVPDEPDPPTTTTTTPEPPTDPTPPVISDETASPGEIHPAGCSPDRASVSAAVTDDVGVESVTLSWTGPDGPGSSPMTLRRGRYYGSLGTFTGPGSVEWTITAADAAGNTAEVGSKIAVIRCPVIG
jgi:RNA polymerase sigma factor (sigma-70 family)